MTMTMTTGTMLVRQAGRAALAKTRTYDCSCAVAKLLVRHISWNSYASSVLVGSVGRSSGSSRGGLRTVPMHRRSYATPPPQVVHSDLPAETYHAYADATMDRLLESLENLLDELDDPEYEVEYSSGVLTLKLGDNGTYVINKQPPNKQIWLSSPASGPKRYDYSDVVDEWVYHRDGQTMSTLLERELSAALGREIRLGVARVSELEA